MYDTFPARRWCRVVPDDGMFTQITREMWFLSLIFCDFVFFKKCAVRYGDLFCWHIAGVVGDGAVHMLPHMLVPVQSCSVYTLPV